MDATFTGVILAAAGGIDLDTVVTAVVSASAVLGAAWITSRVAGRASRQNAMLQWAQQLQASEQAARTEARESRDRAERIKDEAEQDVERLRTQVADLEVRLRTVQALADRLTDTLTSVAAEVWRPEPDVPALRRLVGRPSGGVNGQHV